MLAWGVAQLLGGVLERRVEIDKLIEGTATLWPTEQLAAVAGTARS